MSNVLYQAFICLVFAVSIFPQAYAQKDEDTFQVIIAAEMRDISAPNQSRYAELKHLIDTERSKVPTTFFLFGGGSIGPSAMSNLDRGSHIIDILNSLEPDAMGVSKREFSYNVEELSLRSYEAAFPIVTSNIMDKRINSVPDGLVDSALITRNKVKLGFVSIVDKRLLSEYLVNDITVKDTLESVKTAANNLRQRGANIVLLHFFEMQPEVTRLLDDNIVDYAIISNTRLREASKQEILKHKRIFMIHMPDQAIVAKFSTNPNFSLLSLQRRDLSIMPADTVVENQLNAYLLRLNRLLDDNIAFWEGTYTTRREDIRIKENAFANFVVDAMREYGNTEIALINSGSFNGDRIYNKNTQITRKTIASELSFRSKFRIISVSGKQLSEGIEAGFAGLDYVTGGFPQVSGMQIRYNSSAPQGSRLVSISINGEPLELEKQYQLATIEYLAAGGDDYHSFSSADSQTQSEYERKIFVSDIVLRKLITKGKLDSKVEDRIIDMADKP